MANDTDSNVGVQQMKLAELTAQIVSAYVANNSIRPAELPDVIRAVAASLPIERKAEEPAKPVPAVSVRKSIGQDYLVCLVCGKRQKTLKRHLATAHGMSPAEYREQFGLDRDYPMVAPAYSSARSEMAKQLGLGRRPGQGQGQGGRQRGGRRRRGAAQGSEQSAA